MSIKHYLSAAAALAMFAACSDYDPGMSNQAVDLTDVEIETIKEYTANFVERYGEMDPNHTWGFGELAGEEMETRASNPESNNWIEYTRGKKQKTNGNGEPLYKGDGGTETTERYYTDWQGIQQEREAVTEGPDMVLDFTITGGVKIPGFPVENYYLSAEYNTEPANSPTKPVQNVRGVTTNTPANREGWYHCAFPNEGIEHWFPNKKEVLDYMQGVHPENTLHQRYDEVIPIGDVAKCNTLTEAEVADVYDKFSEEWHGTNPEMDLKSYYVQQVWRGDASYPYYNQNNAYWTESDKSAEPNGYITGGEKMDYLVAKGDNYTAGDNEHFYNFNGSNYSNGQGGMMLIYNSNTQNFAFHNTYMADVNGNTMMWNHYRLLYLHGNWYVGFDFESIGEYEKNIERDYKYNDWIVKIIPGNDSYISLPDRITVTHKRRVMCEDLGSTYDFDFNDLVFDVKYTREEQKDESGNYQPIGDGKWTATITLQAVGGTLPIYIKNFNGTQYDVHQVMGSTLSNGSYSPVNVGTGLKHAPVTLPAGQVSSTNPENIVITVTSPDTQNRTAKNQLVLPNPSGSQFLGTSIAPQKICVPTYVRWTKEYQQIEWAYPNFASWVQNEGGTAGFGHENDWTLDSVEQYLFNP